MTFGFFLGSDNSRVLSDATALSAAEGILLMGCVWWAHLKSYVPSAYFLDFGAANSTTLRDKNRVFLKRPPSVVKFQGIHTTFPLWAFHIGHIKSDFLDPYRSKSSLFLYLLSARGEAVSPLELTFMFDNVILYISLLWEHGRWIQTIPHSLWELNSVWG